MFFYQFIIIAKDLNETTDRLPIANIVLRKENRHILRKVLDFEVEGQRMNRVQEGYRRCKLKKNACKLVLSFKMHFVYPNGLLVLISSLLR